MMSNLVNHLKLHRISEYREIVRVQSSTQSSRSSGKDKNKHRWVANT